VWVRFGARLALVAIFSVLGSSWIVAASARAAVGDLTFTGCIGADPGTSCTSTTPADALVGASALAVSPDGNNVYVGATGGGSGTGEINEFARASATGTLTLIGCIGDDNAQSCTPTSPTQALDAVQSVTVSADGTSVYAAAYGANVIDWFSRNASTGTLTFKGCFGDITYTPGCTSVGGSHAVDGPESVVVSADGTSVYAVAAGQVDWFQRNTSTGALTFKGCIGNTSAPGCTATNPSDALSGATSVAISPDGTSVYAVAGLGSGMIDSFSRNTSTGALTFTACAGEEGTAPCDGSPGFSLGAPTSVTVSPDGDSVYVAASDLGQIAEFSRAASSGALTFETCIGEGFITETPPVSCAGTSPRDALDSANSVTVSADGSSVYEAGPADSSGDVSALPRAGTGMLTFSSCVGDDPNSMGCTPTTPTNALDLAQEVAVSPDGRNVYVAAKGDGPATGVVDELSRTVVACQNVAASVPSNTPTSVTLNCSEASIDPLTYTIVSGPAHGTLGAVSPSGQVTYTPSANYTGSDSFTYMATDAQGSSNIATVTLTIGAGPAVVVAAARQTVTARVGNHRLKLTTPSLLSCLAPKGGFLVTLSSTTIAHATPKLKFSKATFFLGKGIKHTGKGPNGKPTVRYTPNATANHLPVMLTLSLARLKPGKQTLTVNVFYTMSVQGHNRSETKALKVGFKVC
jgi:6-phosphogluconolactonase (cycloisomerase 2 family)